ncbi:MAG: hypothetical protein ACHQ1H_01285 [Nitrososphaerales archaeon]
MNAKQIQEKIISIHTDVEMDFPEAVMTGLDELGAMFIQFCIEVDKEVSAVANEIREIHNSLNNMIGEYSGKRTA